MDRARWRDAEHGENSHKTTLFNTVAHFRGWHEGGQALSIARNRVFMNGMKDLAPIVEAIAHQKYIEKLETYER
jgi:hypothetical protein